MKACLITATKNRHTHLERLVRFSMNQTCQDWTHLIFNNSNQLLELSDVLPKDKYILINKSICDRTNQPYNTLGDIYMDCLKFIPEDCDIINFMDDDDIYLKEHVECGIKGINSGDYIAYKPAKSWFLQVGDKLDLVENTLEPSIFVRKDHVLENGFYLNTTSQHLKWIESGLRKNGIFVDPNGKPTYICDWSQKIPIFKTSGDPHNPLNFNNYNKYSKDNGDNVITPCSEELACDYCRI